MDTAPLTHHEILALVEPFARGGRRVDLAASDRVARRIAFRPVEHPVRDGVPAHREMLSLAQRPEGGWQLVRTRETADDGPVARLQVSGSEPGVLLARVEAIDAAHQLACGPGWTLAIEHRLEGAIARPDEAAAMAASRGVVMAGGLVLVMKVPTVSGISADITLDGKTAGELPDDLLEVLGGGWARLDRGPGGWTSHVGLGGRSTARYRDAEARLRRVATHLAQTLAEPPARFHERLRGARWRVAARRTVPLAAVVALVTAAAVFPSLGLSRESPVWMLIFNAPPLLLALFFSLREMPRIALPRPPRALRDDAWQPVAPILLPTLPHAAVPALPPALPPTLLPALPTALPPSRDEPR